ncbi:MAG: hypothetical protein K9J37_15450 [Saprospiraceae bacterium]|nr:hypothetical protein [Saprospiraceae bacterium]MCF8251306.1 hypothetical protein [Saprospiraceae bacterium]MCF8280607.1 hypothetical protein [Bacteroidales bacterium]MCF8313181.1 hypothetical protein [Saprospiraceae bacterium]MCF8441655.1 hypothetical protein [Saprospiraceae bacterium]
MSRIFYIFLLAILPTLAAAQISNLRSKTIPVLTLPQLLDTITVVPGSVEVTDAATGEHISPQFFTLKNNRISFDTTYIIPHTSYLFIKYRVLPFNLAAPLARLDTSVLKKPGDFLTGYQYDPYADEQRPLLPQRGLDYNGNYTRGLSFGNNQNLVLNSQFNLQMAGTLGDLEILAAITDNNIPLQPEGNTQQLREFDKIFIQVSKDRTKLIAGDYELAKPNGYFMNYFKKLQGATFSRQWAPSRVTKSSGQSGTGKLETKASAAIARGKFARNTLSAQEGNQGPYRLEGAEGERFIIVLSGTEKVFVDGKLQQRGLDADYVIDYNAGHVTFTNRRLITKDSRIVVEFDYSAQDYQRSLYAFNNEWQGKNYRLYLNTYSEQDGRQPIDGDFSQNELEVLRNAGDSSFSAVVSSIDTVEEFSAFRVLYELRDTVVNGTTYPNVLIFSSNQQLAKYSAGFSLVGQGNGNYLLDTETAANGRVYRWVAPDPVTGQPTGQFEPIRRLVAPNRQQLYTAGGEFSPSAKTKLRAEMALSNFDQNRLSGFDDGDNVGLAGTVGMKQVIPLTRPLTPKGEPNSALPNVGSPLGVRGNGATIELETNYEFAQQKFKELNPYRPAEFTRDWNVNRNVNDVGIVTRPSNEHLFNGGATLRTPKMGSLQYNAGGFLRDTLYTGIKHFAKYAYLKNGWDVWAQGDILTSKSTLERSEFFRPKANFAVPFLRDSTGTKYWKAGIYGERERNSRFTKQLQNSGPDTLNAASFYYDLAKIYVESPENETFNFKTSYLRRLDYAPNGEEFSASTTADELNLNGDWQQSRNSRLGWNFTWRQLAIQDTTLSKLDPSDTYLGRLDYSLNLLRGVAQSATSYEIGSGQERKLEFTYLQVPAGEGTHQWTDRNGDGKVQLDEVEIAPFQDVANAVRVTVFTDDFIRTNNVTFNQSLRLEPKAIWFNATGGKKFLSRFSTQSSLQITRKVRQLDGVSAWNPFQLNVADTALVSTRSSVYNTLFFNRADTKYDLQLGMSDNQNKLVQTTGFESRRQQTQFVKTRWNVSKSISFQTEFNLGTDEQGSEQFESKRYRIESWETKPQLTWQPSNNFRMGATWRHKQAENRLDTLGENAKTNDLKWELTFNQSATTSIRSEFSFVKIAFNGQANSPVGFAFLQGLQNGKNFIWSITLDRQVAKNIRIGITYEGRKTGQANLVHVGRAQVGAVF